jgi:hypothetical protein
MKKFGISEFQQKASNYYNLDVIISVGYRVKSMRGTQFRQWATKRLNEYIRKGFTMDDERLKNLGGGGYWKEFCNAYAIFVLPKKYFIVRCLIFTQPVLITIPKQKFPLHFSKSTKQNSLCSTWSNSSRSYFYRADAEKEFMGLMTFPGNRPYLKDVVVAKNYLDEKELRSLGQIVSGYLDFAERQAEREQTMTMKDWAEHLDKILTMSGEKLLQGAGCH